MFSKKLTNKRHNYIKNMPNQDGFSPKNHIYFHLDNRNIDIQKVLISVFPET